MNVYLYVGLVTVAGFVASYWIGRSLRPVRSISAAFLFGLTSVVLAVILCFGVSGVIIKMCALFGLSARQCVETDDQSVWWGALPLLALPAYFVCMFVGRGRPRPSTAPELKRT